MTNSRPKTDLSLNDALIVGATIEDLDIQDIEEFRPFTSKADIIAVLDNLQCGSRNHLRSYMPRLPPTEEPTPANSFLKHFLMPSS